MTQDLQKYDKLWQSMVITKLPQVKDVVSEILKGIDRYKLVVLNTSVPWYFIGVTHYRESDCDFTTHPHNGDSLRHRTVNVPAGRPLGNPPFTWEDSAKDCYFTLKHLDKVTDWSIPSFLAHLEAFNGLGYLQYHSTVNSPYLWSGTSNYTSGKYASDGKFDPNLVDKQMGGAPILSLINKE